MAELELCIDFIRAASERRARRTVGSRFGKATFDDELPVVWYLNTLLVDLDAQPAADELLAEVEQLQGPLRHRRIAVDVEELGARLAPEFHTRGWSVERLLVMSHVRQGRAVPMERAIEIDPDDLGPLLLEENRREGRDGEEARQLVAARRRTREAVHVRAFAVVEDGMPVSSCELYSDGRVAQVENVGTLEEHRGKGFASAVVARAVEEARSEGHELVFLLADEDDWPQELYRKLGFEAVGRIFRFVKAKPLDDARLRAIRLRTPRLELRLASHDELVALAEVAIAGIHPPEEMPFSVAWTDTVTVESFVAYHEEKLASWRPDAWSLDFVVFLDDKPIGTQGVRAKQFAQRHTVETGSWLGMPFQGKGYGKEMRAAVLELAFERLLAVAAESGAAEDNMASRRVTELFGYEVIGESEFAPRGEPVRHVEYRVARESWRCPIEVEIEGLEPALPLFGATSDRSE